MSLTATQIVNLLWKVSMSRKDRSVVFKIPCAPLKTMSATGIGSPTLQTETTCNSPSLPSPEYSPFQIASSVPPHPVIFALTHCWYQDRTACLSHEAKATSWWSVASEEEWWTRSSPRHPGYCISVCVCMSVLTPSRTSFNSEDNLTFPKLHFHCFYITDIIPRQFSPTEVVDRKLFISRTSYCSSKLSRLYFYSFQFYDVISILVLSNVFFYSISRTYSQSLTQLCRTVYLFFFPEFH